MTITKPQAQMLATLAAACRPTGARRWDTAGTMAALERLHDRDLGEVIMATIRAARDRDVDSPGVLPTAGPHWQERLVPAAFVPRTLDAGERCSVCSMSEPACRMRHSVDDHEFKSAAMAAKEAADAAEHVAAVRAELAPTSGPTERRTLEDLAAANPELHARVEAVRAASPGLREPPMQEPIPTAEPEETTA